MKTVKIGAVFGDNPQNYILVLFNILGSLAIFLYAMKLLAGNLQNIIGDKIERALRKLTNKPHKGMVVGALATFLTQSSSITVLTLIGLVNAGILNLRQGVGVILGAEIGTTITAQLVAFDFSLLFFPLIVVGLALSAIGRNENQKSLGKLIFSFGLLLLGMEFMKKAAYPLRESPAALSVLEGFGKTPILGVLVGALFTGITSSSSATTGLVVALGASNIITLPTGIALILGANIGTCLLELIAVVGMSFTAKRVGVAQAVINVLGVLIIFPFLYPFAQLVGHSADNVSRQIANAHTIFNIGSSFFFLFFVGAIVGVAKRIIPGKTVKIRRGTKYIDQNILGMPYVALVNATREVERTGRMVLSMLDFLKQALKDGRNDMVEAIYATEDQIDFLNEEISYYLTAVSGRELDRRSSERLARLLHGISDIERASDHVNRIAEQIEIKKRKKVSFSKAAQKELISYLKQCTSLFEKSLAIFIADDLHGALEIPNQLYKIRLKQEKMRKSVARWEEEKREILLQITHNLERLATHGDNLAETVVSGF